MLAQRATRSSESSVLYLDKFITNRIIYRRSPYSLVSLKFKTCKCIRISSFNSYLITLNTIVCTSGVLLLMQLASLLRNLRFHLNQSTRIIKYSLLPTIIIENQRSFAIWGWYPNVPEMVTSACPQKQS